MKSYHQVTRGSGKGRPLYFYFLFPSVHLKGIRSAYRTMSATLQLEKLIVDVLDREIAILSRFEIGIAREFLESAGDNHTIMSDECNFNAVQILSKA